MATEIRVLGPVNPGRGNAGWYYNQAKDYHLALLAQEGEISIRLIQGNDYDDSVRIVDDNWANWTYYGKKFLAMMMILYSVVGNLLSSRGVSLAVAESCTGGLGRWSPIYLEFPVLLGWVITYSNEAKQEILGVKSKPWQIRGSQPETALAMAKGVKGMAGTDMGGDNWYCWTRWGSRENQWFSIYSVVVITWTSTWNAFVGSRDAIRPCPKSALDLLGYN